LKLAYLSHWVSEIENLSYHSSNLRSVHFTGQVRLPSLELLEQHYLAKVAALSESEKRAGFSLVGPHRDDWTFLIGGHVLKGHGSQGEIRSALLALKLCELALFQKETGHKPIFLLDDFSSELDQQRRHYLLKFLMETDLQTFVTTTEDSSFVGKRYWVSNGVIEEGTNDDRARTVQFG
jgi:DNA replication and repair protein RecF